MREHGPYDVIHSHVASFSGVVLAVAANQRIPVRIAHSHTDRRPTEALAGRGRHAYLRAMQALIDRSATLGLAVNEAAGRSLFGDGWGSDPRHAVLHYGIDLGRYHPLIDDDEVRRASLRRELGITADAMVVGHVGRFNDVKNHRFLVDVFAATHAVRADARLLMVGDGPLRGEIETSVRERGLADVVTFAGTRFDIPNIMRDAIDVFVLPSKHEGSPLVLIEAQAAGTPCLASDTVTDEADAIPSLGRRLGLDEAPEVWADSIQWAAGRRMPARQALPAVEASPFSIRNCVMALEGFYRGD